MKRAAKVEFRVTPEEKIQIHNRAKRAGLGVSEFARRECLGRALSNGGAGVNDSQAKAERVAGSTGASVPVAEPPAKEGRKEFVRRRAGQLYGQGHTSRAAKTQAEREWRELPF